MGKKDKKREKVKGAVKTALKTEKNAAKRMKKELKGDEDIDSIIALFQEEERKKNEITEVECDPPSPRSGLTMCAHPEREELYLFGGEYFNGSKTFMYNQLYIYNLKKCKWSLLTCPNSLLPRCSHQAILISRSHGEMWIFGGEFSSPTQSQFHHYADLWVFYAAERRWEQVKAQGGPSPRSGHRMVLSRKHLVLFGGFHESISNYKYFNDVYAFSLDDRKWTKLQTTGIGPCPRSGCQMAALPDGRILVYGGYSRERQRKDLDKGIFHQDMFVLQWNNDGQDPQTAKWVQVKQTGHQPSPRSGFSMASIGSGDRIVAFGGVCDVEESEESLKGRFYNDLYSLDLEKFRWQQLEVRPKSKKKPTLKASSVPVEEEVAEMKLEDPAATEEVELVDDDGIFTVKIGKAAIENLPSASQASPESKVFVPHSRMNAAVAVKSNILYMYGGIFEDGDRQVTLSDFYSLDLHKLDEWKTLVPLDVKTQEWLESESDTDDSCSGEDSSSE